MNRALKTSPAPSEQPLRRGNRSDETRELLTRSAVCDIVGCSRWTWRRWVSARLAPQPVPGLPGLPKWRASDIQQFTNGRIPGARRHFGSAMSSAQERVSRRLDLVHSAQSEGGSR